VQRIGLFCREEEPPEERISRHWGILEKREKKAANRRSRQCSEGEKGFAFHRPGAFGIETINKGGNRHRLGGGTGRKGLVR